MEEYDVAVIGSGGGLKIALPAAGMGLKTALIDPGPLGGTCLNRGCIPSKILIHPADFLLRMRHASQLNLQWNGDVGVDYPALAARMQADVQQMAGQIERHIRSTDHLTWYQDTASFADAKILRLSDGRCITADRIFIATGSAPSIPPLPGLDGVPYMTSTEALLQSELPESMIILGAGYIACELGHAFGTFGTQIHYLVRSRFLRQEDAEVQRLFEAQFSARHRVHHGVPKEVSYDGKVFHVQFLYSDGRKETVSGQSLLVVSGVTPNTGRLQAEAGGIRLDSRGFIPVNEYLETEAKGVYALGDCVGRYLFRHSVNLEGEYLVRTVLEGGAKYPLDYGPMPHGVFTDPEIAGAGATEEELKEIGEEYVVGRALYADSNAGLARQLKEGFIKLLVQKATGRLLGVHIIGEDACALIQGVLPVMYAKGGVQDLLRTVYIHPAMPELIRDAARDAAGRLS
ncbi:MAG: dihydrolipoyl dehydrogenase [Kiritimatiellae bacterium]|nr:dihydrolipoyl dehydrogenase [Kiritimatiellia bacterium]